MPTPRRAGAGAGAARGSPTASPRTSSANHPDRTMRHRGRRRGGSRQAPFRCRDRARAGGRGTAAGPAPGAATRRTAASADRSLARWSYGRSAISRSRSVRCRTSSNSCSALTRNGLVPALELVPPFFCRGSRRRRITRPHAPSGAPPGRIDAAESAGRNDPRNDTPALWNRIKQQLREQRDSSSRCSTRSGTMCGSRSLKLVLFDSHLGAGGLAGLTTARSISGGKLTASTEGTYPRTGEPNTSHRRGADPRNRYLQGNASRGHPKVTQTALRQQPARLEVGQPEDGHKRLTVSFVGCWSSHTGEGAFTRRGP
jgi:hypothetical protein